MLDGGKWKEHVLVITGWSIARGVGSGGSDCLCCVELVPLHKYIKSVVVLLLVIDMLIVRI